MSEVEDEAEGWGPGGGSQDGLFLGESGLWRGVSRVCGRPMSNVRWVDCRVPCRRASQRASRPDSRCSDFGISRYTRVTRVVHRLLVVKTTQECLTHIQDSNVADSEWRRASAMGAQRPKPQSVLTPPPRGYRRCATRGSCPPPPSRHRGARFLSVAAVLLGARSHNGNAVLVTAGRSDAQCSSFGCCEPVASPKVFF